MEAKHLQRLHREVEAYLQFYSVIYPAPMLDEYVHKSDLVDRMSAWVNVTKKGK